ncbi:MAG: hypothetical protein U0T77_07000 [Chitinophagales bacterium]
MKRIHLLMIFAVLTLFIQTLSAQSDTTKSNPVQKPKGNKAAFFASQNNPAEYADTLRTVLNLSDVQYQKILAIQTDYIQKRKEMRKQSKENPEEDVKQQMKSLKLERNTQVKQVLTPGQLEKWNAWRKQKGEQLKSHKSDMTNPVESDEGF